MKIDRYKIYPLDGYTYENFVSLDRKELEMILTWRNHAEVRKWMMNTAPITLEDHLAYVESLKQRDDAYYWLVRRGGIPVGVLNIMGEGIQEGIGEPGFYLAPEVLNRGEGILLLQNYKKLFLNILDFEILLGHNYVENVNALQLSLFFGAKIDGVIEKSGRKYISISLRKENFKDFRNENIVLSFVRYKKNNPVSISDILLKYNCHE